MKGGKKSERLREREIDREREEQSGWRTAAQSGGFGVEWSGLVVDGGQINDVEQEGEEELRKKREKRGRRWGGVI